MTYNRYNLTYDVCNRYEYFLKNSPQSHLGIEFFNYSSLKVLEERAQSVIFISQKLQNYTNKRRTFLKGEKFKEKQEPDEHNKNKID